MDNSKVLRLLRMLDSNELNELGRFIQSDYFNRKNQVRLLYRQLAKSLKDGKPIPEKPLLYAKIFPSKSGKNPSEKHKIKKVNETLFSLRQMLDQFLLWKKVHEDSFEVNWLRLELYQKRREDHLFFDLLEKMTEDLGPADSLLPDSALQLYQLHHRAYNHPANNQIRGNSHNPAELMESMDYYFLMTKLMNGWVMLGRGEMVIQNRELALMDEALKLASTPPFSENWFIRFYRILVSAHRQNNFHVRDFETLRAIFDEQAESCLPKEQTGLHNALVNFCIIAGIKFAGKDFPNFREALMDLYELGVEKGYLFREGFLGYADFTNCVNIACKLGRFVWADAFVVNYGPLLKPDIREATLHLARAQIAYASGKPEDAVKILNQNTLFTSPVDKVLKRKSLLCCHYDLGQFDRCEYQIESFQKFLMRNGELSEVMKERTQQFLKAFRALILHGHEPEKMRELLQKVEKMPSMLESGWIRERIRQKLEPAKKQ